MAYPDIKVKDLELFVRVVELPTIARVAEHFETTSSTVCRRLKGIEEALGVRLIDRTTRSQNVTTAGEQFYQHCQLLLNEFEIFSDRLRGQRDLPEGHISVYAPSELFSFLINEVTAKFMERYPKLRIEFISGAVKPKLLDDNIDVMIHIDDPDDSSFIARKISTAATSFFASPDYLERRGRPLFPSDMENHDCIAEINHERKARPWHVHEGDTTITLSIRYLYSSDSITLCQTLAEQGCGITMLPDFITRDSVAKGKLVQLFPERYNITHNIYAIYASRKFMPARIRIFIDFLQENLPVKI